MGVNKTRSLILLIAFTGIIIFGGVIFVFEIGDSPTSGAYPISEFIGTPEPTPNPYPMGTENIENSLPPSWDETVISILGDPRDKPKDDSDASLHQGHLGWNKTTQQYIDDPTIRVIESDPSFATLEADKLALLDSSKLTYRSGYVQNVQQVLDENWIMEVENSGNPVYGVIQFMQPFDTRVRHELEDAGVVFYDYVENGGLYCRVQADSLPKLKSLFDAGRVLYAGPIPFEAKISPALSSIDGNSTVKITIVFFRYPNGSSVDRYSTMDHYRGYIIRCSNATVGRANDLSKHDDNCEITLCSMDRGIHSVDNPIIVKN